MKQLSLLCYILLLWYIIRITVILTDKILYKDIAIIKEEDINEMAAPEDVTFWVHSVILKLGNQYTFKKWKVLHVKDFL